MEWNGGGLELSSCISILLIVCVNLPSNVGTSSKVSPAASPSVHNESNTSGEEINKKFDANWPTKEHDSDEFYYPEDFKEKKRNENVTFKEIVPWCVDNLKRCKDKEDMYNSAYYKYLLILDNLYEADLKHFFEDHGKEFASQDIFILAYMLYSRWFVSSKNNRVCSEAELHDRYEIIFNACFKLLDSEQSKRSFCNSAPGKISVMKKKQLKEKMRKLGVQALQECINLDRKLALIYFFQTYRYYFCISPNQLNQVTRMFKIGYFYRLLKNQSITILEERRTANREDPPKFRNMSKSDLAQAIYNSCGRDEFTLLKYLNKKSVNAGDLSYVVIHLITSENLMRASIRFANEQDDDSVTDLFSTLSELGHEYKIAWILASGIKSNALVPIYPYELSVQKNCAKWIAKICIWKYLISKMSSLVVDDILELIIYCIENANPMRNPYYQTTNVLLLSSNLLELCLLLEKRFVIYKSYTTKIMKTVIVITTNYIDKVKNESTFRALLFQKDIEGRDVLEILSQNNIAELMNNTRMEKIALELWGNTLDLSSSWLGSFISVLNYPSDLKKNTETNCNFRFCPNLRKLEQIYNKERHLLQFYIWKESIKARVMTDTSTLLLLNAVYQYYFLKVSDSLYEVNNAYDSYSMSIGTSLQSEKLKELEEAADTYYHASTVVFALSIISVTFLLRFLMMGLCLFKRGKFMQLFKYDNLLYLAFFVLLYIRVGYEIDVYRVNLDDGQCTAVNQCTRQIKYYERVIVDYDHTIILKYIHSFASACLCLLLFQMFRLSRTFGPLFKMIESMLTDIARFMVLLGIEILIFSIFATILFSPTEEYKNLYISCKSLFRAAFGDFDFGAFDSNEDMKYVGDIFLLIFIIVNAILMLNLLIAILSNTYASMEDRKLALYINELLQFRNVYKSDAKLSSLISVLPPWNLPLLFVAPFMCFERCHDIVNRIGYHIAYLPILSVLIIQNIVLNILAIIPTYCYLVYMVFVSSWDCLKNAKYWCIFVFLTPLVCILALPLLVLYIAFMNVFQMVFDTYNQSDTKSDGESSVFLKTDGIFVIHEYYEKMKDSLTKLKQAGNQVETPQQLLDSVIPEDRVGDSGLVPSYDDCRTSEQKMIINMMLLNCNIKDGGESYIHIDILLSQLNESKELNSFDTSKDSNYHLRMLSCIQTSAVHECIQELHPIQTEQNFMEIIETAQLENNIKICQLMEELREKRKTHKTRVNIDIKKQKIESTTDPKQRLTQLKNIVKNLMQQKKMADVPPPQPTTLVKLGSSSTHLRRSSPHPHDSEDSEESKH